MKNTLVTYFEPFGGRTTNASKEVVSLLSGFDKSELPVSWLKIESIIDEILSNDLDYLFLIGEAGSYPEITIERTAHNICNGKDNYDIIKDNEPIVVNGPGEIKTKFDLEGLPYRISDNAGKYLCNYTYYLALSKAKNTKVVFVHLPYIDNNLDNLKNDLLSIINALVKKDK